MMLRAGSMIETMSRVRDIGTMEQQQQQQRAGRLMYGRDRRVPMDV
jgi:hypothetical protein